MELIGAPVATRAMRTSWLDPRERRQELGVRDRLARAGHPESSRHSARGPRK